jgi:hypothetical protein
MMTSLRVFLLLIPALALSMVQSGINEHGAIDYVHAKPNDAIAQLQQKIDKGEVHLDFDGYWGYMPSVLRALKIPSSSQTLVFSKTSLQITRISPQTPRALYFNDDAYVGWVQGGPIMEIADVDPSLGGMFYTLDQEKTDHPHFERQFEGCLLCHESAVTRNVPGFMVLSVVPDKTGYAFTAAGTDPISDQTPLKQRWGGWYVTGTHGDQLHWGNMVIPGTTNSIGDIKGYLAKLNLAPNANITKLDSRLDIKPYLTKDSDLVALMVLTHQTRTHDLITKAHHELQAAIQDDEAFYKELAKTGSQYYSEITAGRIRNAVEPLLNAMLFTWEAEITAPMAGTSSFAADFVKAGPRDHQGRSLRDLDLNRRLFRYPLSYLIYSDAFNALPAPGKNYFYKRLRQVLTGEDKGMAFNHLSDADRKAILEILQDTKPDFVAAK